MPFKLRAGRPKNMGQGIYWVQRERSRSRARVSGELQALRFNNRYHRITSQFLSVFQRYAAEEAPLRCASAPNLIKLWIAITN